MKLSLDLHAPLVDEVQKSFEHHQANAISENRVNWVWIVLFGTSSLGQGVFPSCSSRVII